MEQALGIASGSQASVTGLLRVQPREPRQQVGAAAAPKPLMANLAGASGGRTIIFCQHADKSADRRVHCLAILINHLDTFLRMSHKTLEKQCSSGGAGMRKDELFRCQTIVDATLSVGL